MSGIFKKFKSGDKKITSHDAHKLYTVNVSNHTGSYVEAGYTQKRIVDNVEVDVDLAVFSYESEFDGTAFKADTFDIGGELLKISPHVRTTNGLFKRSLHDSIQAMYYTDTANPANTQHNIGFGKEQRTLFSKAQILSVPQVMMGSGIVPESVIITSGSLVLKDDGFGNLFDTALNSIAVARDDFALDLNFDPLYNQIGKKIKSCYSMNSLADGDDDLPLDNKVRFFDDSTYANKVVARNFIPRSAEFGTFLEFNGVTGATSETRADLVSQSLLRIRDTDNFNIDDGETITIMIKVKAESLQPSTASLDGSAYVDVISKMPNSNSGAYPFRLEYHGATQKYRLSVSDGSTTKSVTLPAPHLDSDGFTSIALTVSQTNSLIIIRTSAVSCTISAIVHPDMRSISNKAPIIVGARSKFYGKFKKKKKRGDYSTKRKRRIEYVRHFNGAVGDFTIYKANLLSADVLGFTNLQKLMIGSTDTANTNKVGNVFYNHGIITLTSNSPRFKQGIRNTTFGDCDILFENTHQIVEQEYTCQIKEQEYGMTLNPTIVKTGKGNELKSFVSSADWSPYVTTIGLYDKNARLLAIGKLAQPIKKSTNYDTTFVVRFDS